MGPTRRRLLQALGYAAPALALPSAGAGALGTSPVRRIVFYVSSHGTVHEDWAIRAGHPEHVPYTLDLASLAEDELSPILSPLAHHRHRMVVVDGLGNAVAAAAGLLAHASGGASSQSGWIPEQPVNAEITQAGPSLDQRIAATRDTPFRSLEWSLRGMPVCFDETGHALPFERDPAYAWKRLFPTVGSAAIGRGQSRVLDLAARQFDGVLGALPAHEVARAELHRDLVHDLEHRLALLDAIGQSCGTPPAPEAPPPADDAAYPEIMIPAFLDLAAVALSCRLTDVITLRVDDIPMATLGAPPGDVHEDLAHNVARFDLARTYMTAHHRFHAQQVARFLDVLAAIPEGEGSLLDSTLVVWHNELATGDHLFHTVPYVLAGLGDTIAGGTYLRLVEHHGVRTRLGPQRVGTPHNKLLASIGVAMGLDLDRCGVDGLEGQEGWIDCTGLLAGVLR